VILNDEKLRSYAPLSMVHALSMRVLFPMLPSQSWLSMRVLFPNSLLSMVHALSMRVLFPYFLLSIVAQYACAVPLFSPLNGTRAQYACAWSSVFVRVYILCVRERK
jgi:hypothetical protein